MKPCLKDFPIITHIQPDDTANVKWSAAKHWLMLSDCSEIIILNEIFEKSTKVPRYVQGTFILFQIDAHNYKIIGLVVVYAKYKIAP
jgi:hypothetical protein